MNIFCSGRLVDQQKETKDFTQHKVESFLASYIRVNELFSIVVVACSLIVITINTIIPSFPSPSSALPFYSLLADCECHDDHHHYCRHDHHHDHHRQHQHHHRRRRHDHHHHLYLFILCLQTVGVRLTNHPQFQFLLLSLFHKG